MGETKTTIDYILLDVEASSLMDGCGTLQDHDLNTSDHLPQFIALQFSHKSKEVADSANTRIDWSNIQSSEALSAFQSEVSAFVTPLLNNCYEDIDCLNKELELVSAHIIATASATLPAQQERGGKRPLYYKDSTLKFLCDSSKSIWKEWCSAGRPQSGPLFERKKDLRNEVRKRIRLCAAVDERKRIRKRESLFLRKDAKSFRPPHKKKCRCSKLRVDGKLISDRCDLLKAWSDHFSTLSKSRLLSEVDLQNLDSKMDDLDIAFLSNEEYILDVPFSLEEVVNAVMKLKLRKSGGPDGIIAEHLRWGGETLHLWLLRMLNSIIKMEEIPPFNLFKSGLLCPVYKGGGKDPFLTTNYRGITMNSVLLKVLEILVLSRMKGCLAEAGFPHLNQSAFRKHVGCADAIFASQEMIARYMSEGSTVRMYLLDLQKAFDSVEFPVLLSVLHRH